MQTKYIPPPSANPSTLLRKTVTLLTTVALAGVALMFSAMLLAFILVVAALGSILLWWKTRELRKQMQNFPTHPHSTTVRSDAFAGEAFNGEVIEGEVIRVDESRAS